MAAPLPDGVGGSRPPSPTLGIGRHRAAAASAPPDPSPIARAEALHPARPAAEARLIRPTLQPQRRPSF